jgi:SsrA-binding protein
MAKKTTATPNDNKALSGTIALNRRARHDYEILDRVEAGVVLTGSEVKSAREHRVQLQGSYARIKDGEAWLVDAHFAPYVNAGYSPHEPRRDRKLLLHRKEIRRLEEAAATKGLTLVPLAMYFKGGRVKVEVGVARGRRSYDKRQAIAEREAAIDVARGIRRNA